MAERHICFVVTEDWYFVSHRLPLAVAVSEAGFQVSVITREGRKANSIREMGIRLIPFEMDRRGMNPLKELATVLRLARLLRQERPDLLHLVALKPVLLGNLAARLAGVKCRVSAVAGMGFLFTEGGRGGFLMPVVRRLLGWGLSGSAVIVQNPDDAGLLERLGVAADAIRLIRGAGVDLDKFLPLPEPPGPPVVMLPSRLLWDKGVGEFVEAARRLRNEGTKVRFVLVGAPDPDNPAAVSERELRQWENEGVVEWWGHQQAMEKVLPQAHLVCLPSYREGLPKVLLETMACGRAVVTCDVPGCREAVLHEHNGLLVPARDAGALAHAIGRLLKDVSLRSRFGAAGRERAERLFSTERVARETLGVYQELLEREGA